MNGITYYRRNGQIQSITYHNCDESFPLHTHNDHLMLGVVKDGNVVIGINGNEAEYMAGMQFIIMPNVAHTLRPGNEKHYTMTVICVKTNVIVSNEHLSELWRKIIDEPENVKQINEMAEQLQVSPYHFIRQFKQVFGLTPHAFQIQSRVRKAQRIIEAGADNQDAVYLAGFYDESHMDRCFQKYVKMTPGQYRESIRQNR